MRRILPTMFLVVSVLMGASKLNSLSFTSAKDCVFGGFKGALGTVKDKASGTKIWCGTKFDDAKNIKMDDVREKLGETWTGIKDLKPVWIGAAGTLAVVCVLCRISPKFRRLVCGRQHEEKTEFWYDHPEIFLSPRDGEVA